MNLHPSILGLSSPNPDLLPWFFSLAVPRAVIWERTGREERAELLSKHLNPQELSWLLPHPHPGGASRAEQEQEQEQPGLMTLSAVPRAQSPSLGWLCLLCAKSLHPRLAGSSTPCTVTENTGPARTGAFGTGTSQSIACMFGDALL